MLISSDNRFKCTLSKYVFRWKINLAFVVKYFQICLPINYSISVDNLKEKNPGAQNTHFPRGGCLKYRNIEDRLKSHENIFACGAKDIYTGFFCLFQYFSGGWRLKYSWKKWKQLKHSWPPWSKVWSIVYRSIRSHRWKYEKKNSEIF